MDKIMREAVQKVQKANKIVGINMTDEETAVFLEFVSDAMIIQEMKKNYAAKLASDSIKNILNKMNDYDPSLYDKYINILLEGVEL